MKICKESDVFKDPEQKISANRHFNFTKPIDLHAHEFIEMSLVTEGSSLHTINGREFKVERGDFLIMNSTVLYPPYAQAENDKKAAEALKMAFPSHEIVGIDSRALIKQHGSLHCVTMQYPR